MTHPLDIRRPLGKPRPIPPAAFVPTADFFAGAGWLFSVPAARQPQLYQRL